MRFTESGRSRGYLHGILLDGAKPFLYRGGVRALLGVPDGGGGITYAPPLPPAGFQYVHRSGDGPRAGSPDGDNEVVKEYPDRIARSVELEDAHDAASRIEALPLQRAAAPAVTPRAATPVPTERKSMPQPRQSAAESPAHAERDDSSAAISPRAEVMPQASSVASLEVPGMSHAVRDFPALRATVKPEELAVRRDEGNTSREKPLPAEPRETRDVGEHAYRSDEQTTAPVPIAMPRRERQQRGTIKEDRMGETGNDESIERIGHPAIAEGRALHEERIAPIVRRAPQMPAPARRPATHAEVVEEGPYLEPIDPTAGALSIRGAIDGRRRGTEGVEQIVERVIARRAAEEGWESAERRVPEPQARVVVVDNRGAQGPKIPCAFWERSYLHRFRIRTLR